MLVDVPLDQFLHGWSRATAIPRCQRIMPEIDVALLASCFLPRRRSGPIRMIADEHSSPPTVDDIIEGEALAAVRPHLDTKADEFVIPEDRRATVFFFEAVDEPFCNVKSHPLCPSAISQAAGRLDFKML